MNSIQRSFPLHRSFFEALFAFHFALAIFHSWIVTHEWTPGSIYWIEYRMNDFFGIPNTDFPLMYFGTGVPVALVGSVLWGLLRWSWGIRFADIVLPRLAGYLIMMSPIAIRLVGDTRPLSDWLIGTLFCVGSSLGLVLVGRTLQQKIAATTAVLCFGAIDYVLWRVVGTSMFWSHYDAPPGAILGFCAIAAWVAYVNAIHSRQRLSNEA